MTDTDDHEMLEGNITSKWLMDDDDHDDDGDDDDEDTDDHEMVEGDITSKWLMNDNSENDDEEEPTENREHLDNTLAPSHVPPLIGSVIPPLDEENTTYLLFAPTPNPTNPPPPPPQECAGDRLVKIQAQQEALNKRNAISGCAGDRVAEVHAKQDAIWCKSDSTYTNAGERWMATRAHEKELQDNLNRLTGKKGCAGDRVVTVKAERTERLKNPVLPTLLRRRPCAGDRVVAIQNEKAEREKRMAERK